MNETTDHNIAASRFFHIFPLIVLALYGITHYFLSGENLPMHDSRADFVTFVYFYRAFFFHGEFSHWIPNLGYGIATYLEQLGMVTPSTLTIMLFGKLFGITDTIFLFRLRAVIDFIPFALGLCLLCRLWFRHPLTWLLVCTAACMGTFVDQYLLVTYRLYYMLPLTLYCFCRFYLDAKAWWFWLGGIVAIVGFFGNIPYIAPIWLLLLTALQIPLVIRYPSAPRTLLGLKWSNIFPFFCFLAVSFIYLILLFSTKDGIFSMVAGRNNHDFSTPLNVYLTHSVLYNPLDILRLLFSGCKSSIFFSTPTMWMIYIGVLPLLLSGLAAVRVRNVWVIVLLVGALICVEIASAGLGTLLSYYFPGMDYFRYHLTIWEIFRVFILLLAGWGCDYALSRLKPSMLVWAAILLILALCLTTTPNLLKCLSASPWRTLLIPDLQFWHQFGYIPLYGYRTTLYVVVLLSGAFLLIPRVQNWHPAKNSYLKNIFYCVVMIVLLFDLMSFRFVYTKLSNPLPADQVNKIENAECMQAKPITYIPRRKDLHELTDEQFDALWACSRKPGGCFAITHAMADFDDWIIVRHEEEAFGYRNGKSIPTAYTIFLITDVVHSLFSAFLEEENQIYSPDDDKFRFLVGNTAPKLRFAQKAVFCQSEEEAAGMLKQFSLDALHTTVVLLNSRQDAIDAASTSQDEMIPIAGNDGTNFSAPANSRQADFHAKVYEFSSNHAVFDIEVSGMNPGWLVYCDSYTPAWSATVDGISVPVERANLAFKAVRVDPGKHRVAFHYRGNWRVRMLDLGVLVCILFGVLWIGWFLWICLFPSAVYLRKSETESAG